MYTIRFCRRDEHNLLIDFIRDHWRADHVFVRSKEILDWQYLEENEERYNFVVAYNEETKEFDAILGFIPTAHFDPNLATNKELWLAIWRLKDSASTSFSGMNLLHFLRNKLKPEHIYAIGITDVTKNIYKVLGYQVDKMSHFYINNVDVTKPTIASFSGESYRLHCDGSSDIMIEEIKWSEYRDRIATLLEQTIIHPKKSVIYFEQRYLTNVWLNYRYLGIFKDNSLYGVIVFRVVEALDSCCLRIMDWIGEFPSLNLIAEFQNVLKGFNAEYIDFVCRVPDEIKLINMGFKKKDSESIIPEYFNPFVAENIDIFYCARSKSNYRLVKGDSDQDRPNIL